MIGRYFLNRDVHNKMWLTTFHDSGRNHGWDEGRTIEMTTVKGKRRRKEFGQGAEMPDTRQSNREKKRAINRIDGDTRAFWATC